MRRYIHLIYCVLAFAAFLGGGAGRAVCAALPAEALEADGGKDGQDVRNETRSRAGRGRLVEMKGSFLRQIQKRDSVLIADQLEYGVRLDDVDESTGLGFPDMSKMLGDSMVVVHEWQLDTLKTVKARKNASAKYNIEAYMVVTSFEEGEYDLPPVVVLRQSADGVTDTLVFDVRKVKVCTMPVDTAVFVPHDIKGQVKYPVTFREILPYGLGLVLLAVLVWLIIRLITSRTSGIAAAPAEPAHIVALRKLDGFRGNKFWTPEKQKLFYSGITDILREYISARYEVGAMEMTTAEIFDALKDCGLDKELFSDLHELFKESDFVKFAKYVLPEEDNAKVLPLAVRFVTSTYQKDIDEEEKVADDNVPAKGKE